MFSVYLKISKNFDLCGRLPCFDAHCYNAPYISILCGMLDMSRRKAQVEIFGQFLGDSFLELFGTQKLDQ